MPREQKGLQGLHTHNMLCFSSFFLSFFPSLFPPSPRIYQASRKVLVSQMALVLKSLPVNADVRDASLIPGSGRFPGNPLQYSCLEHPMDRGAWQAAVHGVAKSRTRLSDLAHMY